MSSPAPSTTTHSILTLPQFSSVSPARLIVLYSDFGPQKGSNPPGFQANLVWWKSVLEAASEKAYFPSTEGAGGAIVIDVGDALGEALRQEGGGRAIGLGSVVVSSPSPPSLAFARSLPSLALLSPFNLQRPPPSQPKVQDTPKTPTRPPRHTPVPLPI